MHKPVSRKKIIVLGIDAMDPNIIEQLIKKGRLPNLSYLKETGSYSPLATTMPPESPVAWSSFSTGLSPGDHGIFDFIMRDPQNYLPYLSLNEISTDKGKVKIQIRRKGDAFWNILSRKKIPCFIYFCPNTFPPEKILGRMLSGMGVTDIKGTEGNFSFYTAKPLSEEDKNSRGKIIQIKPKNNVIDTEIYGPRIASGSSISEAVVPLKINLVPDEQKIRLEFQGNRIWLYEDKWSDWQRLYFRVGPFRKIYGIVRFYLKAIKPEFELYMSPINFDPQKPPFPISYPYNYSKKLAERIGLFYTQGMPHDTWVLSENRLNEKIFLGREDEILNEKKMILREGLKEFKEGLFFFYFDTLDTVQHMFWRYIDKRHPLYEENSLYQDTIFKYYEKIDQVIGEVLKSLDNDTTLIILSDHGFNSFRRSVHLNRWLLESGYLFLKEGTNESGEFFEDLDWPKTKAYALGFGGIYLNMIGRESYGSVNPSEAQDLKQAIIKGLKQLRDPKTGEAAVRNVYSREEIFQGQYINNAPDLFVGFNAGYRASWRTALGGVPNSLIEDNKRKWSGEHLIDSSLVPGVIFVNKKTDLEEPAIIDVAPTLLSLFGIDKPEGMKGKVLFRVENK